MATVLDFRSNEAAQGTFALPITLTTGVEVFLTSITLNISATTNESVFWSTVGWQGDTIALTPANPTLTFRIRRGSPSGAIIFETNDSQLIGLGAILSTVRTFSSVHTDLSQPPFVVGTTQTYFLTVVLSGIGSASIIGPVNLTGFVMG
ncbi:hypothetical protein ACFQZT_08800 [Paenibacillus sp. GCM10027628]|uniref:hypothetical protein n=1 Tax=Paenibacillus sp. GCM10027628 TaxID=3273413 RepID=UPI00363CED02